MITPAAQTAETGGRRLADEIDRTDREAVGLEQALKTEREKLAAILVHIDNYAPQVSEDDIKAARRDVSEASARIPSWKSAIGRLQDECRGLSSRTAQARPGEKGQAERFMLKLKGDLVMLRGTMSQIEDLIVALLDRIMRLTERH